MSPLLEMLADPEEEKEAKTALPGQLRQSVSPWLRCSKQWGPAPTTHADDAVDDEHSQHAAQACSVPLGIGELLIDLEEGRAARAIVFGLLSEMERK